MALLEPKHKASKKIYGRESQLKILKDAFHRAQQPDEPTQIGFIRGPSGTGKTALIHHAFNATNGCCLYGSGKFEERLDPKPFAVLSRALAGFCLEMARLNQKHYEELLTQGLQPEALSTLADLVPEISKIVNIEKDPEKYPKSTRRFSNSKEGPEKLYYTLRLFLRAISSPEVPVVLFLDDIHWIDSVTLALLQSVLSDHETTNVLFAGCYRDNEVESDHILIKWIEDIQEEATQIRIGDLSVESVEMLLTDALKNEHVRDLADLIHSRTSGNIFHVLQLLDYLQSEKLLQPSYTSTWTWDIARLRAQTSSSENVVEVVRLKLVRLHSDVRAYLKLSSLLGFRFDESILNLIHNGSTQENQLQELSVEECQAIAIQEGVLERLQNGWLKFVHDRIHQAALRLADDEDEAAKIHLEIGTIIWKHSGLENSSSLTMMDDRLLFVCCDQLNLGRKLIEDKGFQADLARLNGEASTRASTLSAFVPAIGYLRIGLSLLDPYRRWIDHYELSLDFFTSIAEMCFCAGQLDDCEKEVKQVLTHAKSIDDSIRAYLVWTQCLAAQAKYQEQVRISLNVLKQLGEQVPSNPGSFYTRRVFEKTQRKLKAKSDSEILALPLMVNQHKIAAVQILSEMMMTVDNLEMYNLTSTLTCRMTKLTFQYGLAPYSALGFALNSQLFVAKKNDIDSGFRFAGLAVALLEKLDAARLSSRVYLHSGFAFHWRQPLSMTVDYWIDAHQSGMRNGDINAAAHNITGYGIAYFYSGLPLASCATDLNNFCKLMDKYGQKMMTLANVPLYQCVLNLTGQSENVLDMSNGKACDYRKTLGWENRVGEHAEWSYHMQVAFYCEEFGLATQLYDKLEPVYAGAARAMPLFHARVFFYALICMHNAKKNSKKRKYRVEARKHLDVVRGWVVEKRAINVVHKLMILDAEMMTLDKKADAELVVAFDKAIGSASKAGFLQDAALAAHLASRAVSKQRTSLDYFERARTLYLSWDARGVVDHLESSASTRMLHADAVPVSGATGTSYRSRQRFDNAVMLEHQSLEFRDGDAMAKRRSILKRASLSKRGSFVSETDSR